MMSEAWRQHGNTAQWKRIRKAVLIRDDYRCQLRLSVCTGYATQVHHKLGRAITGDSMPEFLCASCKECNLAVGQPNNDTTQPTHMTEW